MKATQVTELFANIRKTFVSFFSILMFVALGVGIFVGINWTAPALENVADDVFDEYAFHHVQVSFPYGLTDADLAELSAVEGVTGVEKARQSFVQYKHGGNSYTVKLQTMGQDIDKMIVKEGELPHRDGELAFKASIAQEIGVSVGDVITFEHDAVQSAETSSAALGTSDSGAVGGAVTTNTSGMKQLTTDSFKVTALVESPDYLALDPITFGYSNTPTGRTDALAWVLPSAFSDAAYYDAYTTANIRCEGLQGLGSFSGEYKRASKEIEQRITELGDRLGSARYDSLHGEAQKKVDDGEAQLNEAEGKIAEGEQAITDGTKKLEEGRATLEQKRAEGEKALDEAYAQLQQFESLRVEGEQKLNELAEMVDLGEGVIARVDEAENEVSRLLDDAEEFYNEQKRKLDSGDINRDRFNESLDKRGRELMKKLEAFADLLGMEVLSQAIAHENFTKAIRDARNALKNIENVKVDVGGKRVSLREGRQMIKDLRVSLGSAQAEYDARVTQLNEAWSKYHDGQQKLEDETAAGQQKIAEGEAQLEQVRQQVDEGKAKVAEMKPKLEDAKQQVEAMKKYDWTVIGRPYNSGAFQVSILTGVTGRLSFSMAALFVIVGLLVSYSAVSRIVHEQITQIGTKKALGLRNREITLSFLLYSAIAVVIGSIVGAIAGVFMVENIISNVLGLQFITGAYPPYFGWPSFLGVSALELVLVIGATWLACHTILREQAVELLKGEKPPEAKTRFYEKWGLWDRLPLFTQTIVNNCMNDKRRVFSTIVGVAGCTALIVTAITFNDDVLNSYDEQYGKVYDFNAIAYTDSSVKDAANNTQVALEREGATCAQVLSRSFAVTLPSGERSSMRVIVPADDKAFSQVYRVNVTQGGEFDPSSDGLWISQAYAAHLGAQVGDEVALDTGDGAKHRLRIVGFYEFYLMNYEMVMTRNVYEREFGESLDPNAVLVQTHDQPVDKLSGALEGTPGFYSMLDDKSIQKRNFNSFASISSTVVLVYLALAVLMAVVVLLNLNVMFIQEKKRDLIVLMINGFSTHDAKRYIYNDTIVLTAAGIVIGLVLGCAMGSVTVGAIEPNTALFMKGVSWRAVAAGALGSAVLAFAMSFIALRRIPRFELTDINKF